METQILLQKTPCYRVVPSLCGYPALVVGGVVLVADTGDAALNEKIATILLRTSAAEQSPFKC